MGSIGPSTFLVRLSAAALLVVAASSAEGQPEQPYRIGVYYHGVWSAESCNVCYSGNTDWWRGVREYAAGQVDPNLPWWQESFVHLEPALGYYDSSNRHVLARQIRQAKANGLSFFTFNWYWGHGQNGGLGGEKFGASLKAFLAAPNTLDLDFALTITAHPWDDLQIPNDHIPAAVTRLLAYFSQPHYLRTADGRPILFFTDTRGLRAGHQRDFDDFTSYLESRALQEMGVSPFFVIATEREQPSAGFVGDGPYLDLRRTPSLDAVSCYNEFYKSIANRATQVVGSLQRYNQEMRDHYRTWAGIAPAVIPCYMADFNEKPRTEVGVPSHWIRYVNDFSYETFRAGLEELKRFSDNHDGKTVDDMVLLYAWNEWREAGHSLEPSRAEGNLMLNEVSRIFGLETWGLGGCQVVGDCPESKEFPTGSLDRSDCDLIAGWARDPDTSLPTQIEIVPEGSQVPIAVVAADRFRGDLPFRDRHHGYAFPTPDGLKTGSAVRFTVRAANIGLNGNPVGTYQTLRSSVSLTCGSVGGGNTGGGGDSGDGGDGGNGGDGGSGGDGGNGGGGGGGAASSAVPPAGTFDVARCDVLAGWSRDAESTVPLLVEIYRGGPRGAGGTLIASQVAENLRGDLPFADQHHGFRIFTPEALKTGATETLYAYGRDVDPNGNPTQLRQLLAGNPKSLACTP